MPTNITGFQMMRRKQLEKSQSQLKNKGLDGINNENELPNNDDESVSKEKSVPEMTIEEVRAKLTEMNVYFQPNTGEAKLKAKLEGVLNGTE